MADMTTSPSPDHDVSVGAGSTADVVRIRRTDLRPGRRAPHVDGLEIHSFAPAAAGSADSDRFVDLGARLQAQTPGRIVTSMDTTRKRISPAFSFYANGSGRMFVASVNGEDVGRCAALVNERAARDEQGGQPGYVGLWECIDDEDVAHALLDAAVTHLLQSGCTSLVGPMDFSTWYGYRFCTGPFDGHPIALEPYTPPHYEAHWRSYGWTDQLGYLTTVQRDIPHGLTLGGQGCLERAVAQGYRFTHLRMNVFGKVLKTLYRESMKAFEQAPNFAPIEWDEFQELYAGIEKVLDPRLVWFVLAPNGEVAGFAFGVPDYARAQQALRGRSSLGAKLAALANMRRADGVLFKTLMVSPKHQGHGLSIALTHQLWKTAYELGYERVHHVLMHENNSSLTYSERGQTVLARRYSLFELEVPRT
jgi:hypothetical protein